MGAVKKKMGGAGSAAAVKKNKGGAGAMAAAKKKVSAGGRRKLATKTKSSGDKPPTKKPVVRRRSAAADAAESPIDLNKETPNSLKMQIFVKSAHHIPFSANIPPKERSEDNRHFVCMMVEPTLTVECLKTMLMQKSFDWIPKCDLVLVKEGGNKPLGSLPTLGNCNIKYGDTLLACTDNGDFKVLIYHNFKLGEFEVSARSCFETIGDVKKKICGLMGYKPEAQILTSYIADDPLEDKTPLVALGIVKPYMREMAWVLPRLKLAGPVPSWEDDDGSLTLTRGLDPLIKGPYRSRTIDL